MTLNKLVERSSGPSSVLLLFSRPTKWAIYIIENRTVDLRNITNSYVNSRARGPSACINSQVNDHGIRLRSG